jgi:hypothetical protein
MDINLVPPHNHRVNAAKRAIAIFKKHFISALATVNRNCPLQLWDDFLPQVELTLNLLQIFQWDPTKSANKEVNGKFDYSKTPLEPLGTKGLVYDDPATHASWAPHGTNAYYIGPTLKHYRCLRFYMPGTRQYWVANMWHLLPLSHRWGNSRPTNFKLFFWSLLCVLCVAQSSALTAPPPSQLIHAFFSLVDPNNVCFIISKRKKWGLGGSPTCKRGVIYPTHCIVPTLSPTEHMIIEATDTLTALNGTVPTSTKASVALMQAIQNLHDILIPVLHQGTSNPIATDTPSPRVQRPRSPATPEPRVPTLGPSPRVMLASAHSIALSPTSTSTQTPTTLHDPKAPANI